MNLRKSSTASSKRGAIAHDEARSVIGMRRWMRLTARKHSVTKDQAKDSSKAAADALETMLGARGSQG